MTWHCKQYRYRHTIGRSGIFWFAIDQIYRWAFHDHHGTKGIFLRGCRWALDHSYSCGSNLWSSQPRPDKGNLLGYSAMAKNWTRVEKRTDSQTHPFFHWAIMPDSDRGPHNDTYFSLFIVIHSQTLIYSVICDQFIIMGKPSPDWLPLLFNAVFSFKGPSTLMWNEPSEIYPQMSLMYFEHDFKVWHFLVLGCNQTRPIVLLWCNWPHGHMIPRLHLPIFFEFMRRIMPSIRHIMDHWETSCWLVLLCI